jgi:hypothetical protein
MLTQIRAKARSCAIASVGLALLLLHGCAQIPQKEFGGYRQVFNETQQIAKDILGDYVNTRDAVLRAEAKKKEAENAAKEKADAVTQRKEPYPLKFSVPVPAAGSAAPDEVAVRLRALETVSRYNELLSALAEGKSVEGVQASAKSLGMSLQNFAKVVRQATKFASAFDSYLPLVSTALEVIEKARVRQEFIKAVRAGEPVVLGILDVFIADTPDFYAVRHSLVNPQRARLETDIVNAAGAIQSVMAGYKLPTEKKKQDELKDTEAKLNQMLAAIDFAELPFALKSSAASGGAAEAPYSELVDSQIGQFVTDMARSLEARNKVVSDLLTYHDMLSHYVELLNQTKRNLALLAAAIDAPHDIRPSIDEVLTTVLEVRREFLMLKAAR